MKKKLPTLDKASMKEGEMGHPSLALGFLLEQESRGERCLEAPGLFDIHHSNVIWQEARVAFTTFLLFSAFLDTRNKEEGTSIRILALSDSAWPPTPTCHLYDSESPSSPPLATRAVKMDFLHWQYPIKGEWHPFMITCLTGIKNGELRPTVVSVVPHPCSPPTNALRVHSYNESSPKADLALCTKFIYGTSDYSLRLIEWLETAKAWGVDQVDIRLMEVHPNVSKVLNFYEEEGFLKIGPWMNPALQPNVASINELFYDTQRYSLFVDENIPYTDCLLRHLGTHRYVGVWDLDEFVIPVRHTSITSLVDSAYLSWKEATEGKKGALPPTSYLFRTSYFFDDFVETFDMSDIQETSGDETMTNNNLTDNITSKNSLIKPPEFHLLTHTKRTLKFTQPAVFTKAIHDTTRALGLHAHFALYNIEGQVDRVKSLYHAYPISEGYLGHYRSQCQGEDQTECEADFRPYVQTDRTLWKHAERVIRNSRKTFKELFVKDEPCP